MQAKLDGVIGDRHQDHGSDREGQAKAPAAVAQETARSLALQAGPDEQSRQEEHRRHEVAVVEDHHRVEAHERLAVGMAVIGVGDDGVV